MKRNERDWAGQLISWIKETIRENRTIFQEATNDTGIKLESGKTKFPDILLFTDKVSGIVFNGWELKFPDTAVDDRDMLENALEKAKRLKSESFVTCDDSECCYDRYMVVYCKTNCPYPNCSPIVSIVHGIGYHTISEPCTPPCYSWCGKYSFEDPETVPDLQDVTTSEPYSGVFIPKLNLEIGNNNNNKDIKIIPNPVNSNCTIEIDNEYYGNAEIIIYDASGNIVSKLENKKEKGLLSIVTNLNNLVTGVYYCSVRIDGIEIGNKSFIINK